MGIEKKSRPKKVEAAIRSGNTEAIRAFASAGGEATAKKWDETHAWRDMEAEMHEKSMQDVAMARKDDELSDP